MAYIDIALGLLIYVFLIIWLFLKIRNIYLIKKNNIKEQVLKFKKQVNNLDNIKKLKKYNSILLKVLLIYIIVGLVIILAFLSISLFLSIFIYLLFGEFTLTIIKVITVIIFIYLSPYVYISLIICLILAITLIIGILYNYYPYKYIKDGNKLVN